MASEPQSTSGAAGPDQTTPTRPRYVAIAGRRFRVPQSRSVRVGAGVALACGGVLGFLPVLGFWMLPLGLILLSVDLPMVRRWRRRLDVRIGRWRNGRGDAASS